MKLFRLLALLSLALFAASLATASDKQDVQNALIEWKAAVESAKLDDIMKLYDKKAVMISTFAQQPMTKREQIEGYFKKVIPNPDIKVEIQETNPRVFGNIAVDSGRYTLSYTQEGEPVSVPARFTFVYQLQGGKWVIIEQHSSRVWLPDEEK